MLWEITLFGPLSLRDPAGRLPDVTRFRTQKAAALLAYLALQGAGRLCARETLTDALWPDVEPVTARNRFKQELATLRRQIEPLPLAVGDVLESGGRTHVGLAPGAVMTDVCRFDRLVAEAGQSGGVPDRAFALLREATDLHNASGLLPNLYEEWLSGERERLRSLYVSALRRMLDLHTRLGAGDSAFALSAARALIAAARLDENAHAALIRLLIARGDGPQARQQLERWRILARDELGASVSPALERLLAVSSVPPAPAAVVAAPVAALVPHAASSGHVLPARFAAPVPLPRTRFFGRDDKMADLLALLKGSFAARVVTLTGPGGAGKTRLAQELARALTGPASDARGFALRGWVSLADVTDPERLPDALFSSLFPNRQQGDGDPLARLIDALHRDPLAPSRPDGAYPPELLILDNLEQVSGDGGAPLIHTLTEQVPHLVCLCTSRRPVGVEGECVIPLAPLPLPSLPPTPTASDALAVPSVALWVDRARAVAPDFQMTDRNVADITAICRLLDGLPLALEITAARAGLLSPSRLRHALESGKSDALVSRRRDIAPRHRSLRETALWSYELLPPDLKRLWARLSVFQGGWTLQAAVAVAGEDHHNGDAEAEMLNALDALQQQSLIVADTDSPPLEGETRFRMLETLREFASEQLSPDEARDTGERHLAFCLTLTAQADRELRGAREAYWMQRLEAEHPNLRAALRFGIAQAQHAAFSPDDPLRDAALRLCDEVAQFWWLRGYLSEGRDWFRQALASAPPHPPRLVRAEALRSAAALALNQDDNQEAHALASESLAVAMRIENRRGIGYAHHTLGRIALSVGDFEAARRHLEQAVAVMDTWQPQPPLIANAQAVQRENLGVALQNLGLLDEADAVWDQCMSHWRREGLVHRYNVAALLVLQSELAFQKGETERAQVLAAEGLSIQREMGIRGPISRALLQMGRIKAHAGNAEHARLNFAECLRVARDTGKRRGVVDAVEALSALDLQTEAPRMGEWERGARLWGWAQMRRQQFDLQVPPSELRFWQEGDALLTRRFGQAQRVVLLTEGGLLREDAALALALTDVPALPALL